MNDFAKGLRPGQRDAHHPGQPDRTDATREQQAENQEDNSEQITPPETREHAQENLRIAMHALTDACGPIPYRILGSAAHFLHNADHFLQKGTLPDDIDIAVQNGDDLEKIFRRMSDYKDTVGTQKIHIICNAIHRIDESAQVFSGFLCIENKKIPFEIFSNTAIIPKTTWSDNTKREGISLLSGEDLRKQYGEIAKREAMVWEETSQFLQSLINKARTEEAGSEKIARMLLDRFPDTNNSKTRAIVHALSVLTKFPENSPEGKSAISAVAHELLGIKTGKNRAATLEILASV